MADKKIITPEYLTELLSRIAKGERPQKIVTISQKAFVEQMLPHVKDFLAQDYTYKAIAEFIGHVSVAELRKVVKKSLAEDKEREKAAKKEAEKNMKKQKKTAAPAPKPISTKSAAAKSTAQKPQAGSAAP